jgi:hypothetical protein
MTHEEKLQKLAELEAAAMELRASIAADKTPKVRFKPAYGDDYSYVDYSNSVSELTWCADIEDEANYARGNCYRTEAEAIAARNRQLAIVRVNDAIDVLNDGWVPDWSNNGQQKLVLARNNSENGFCTTSTSKINYGAVLRYCKTSQITRDILESHDADLRLIFGVGK